MDLLERDRPLADMTKLLADCADGGRIAVVSGEAGAGKSALVSAFADTTRSRRAPGCGGAPAIRC